jgi:hypothetical protein
MRSLNAGEIKHVRLQSIANNWDQLQSIASLAITCNHMGSLAITWDHLRSLASLAITFLYGTFNQFQSGPCYFQYSSFFFVGGKGYVYFYMPITIFVHADVELITSHLHD